jgi:hypothetical protein
MTHLVQIANGPTRRVALVEEPYLRCLLDVESVYALAQLSLRDGVKLGQLARTLAQGDLLDYNAIYAGTSEWHLLPPIDVPGNPSRLMIAGTGLTHLGSAKERQAMHAADAAKAATQKREAADEASQPTASQSAAPITDSMKMFQWGVAGGRPAPGKIGIAPEWFYKGTGSVLRAPFEPLTIPPFAEDGGEEAEVAGIYLIAPDGHPHRIGMAAGNEFSDHQFERRNYLNLAGSKLRTCSLGPELVLNPAFHSIEGEARIERNGRTLWSKPIATGEDNMCHSLANLEHHHFKFEGHRQPGDVHVHFFGAHSLSFGDGIVLEDGDIMEVRYEGFGRALRNPVRIQSKDHNQPIVVHSLA